MYVPDAIKNVRDKLRCSSLSDYLSLDKTHLFSSSFTTKCYEWLTEIRRADDGHFSWIRHEHHSIKPSENVPQIPPLSSSHFLLLLTMRYSPNFPLFSQFSHRHTVHTICHRPLPLPCITPLSFFVELSRLRFWAILTAFSTWKTTSILFTLFLFASLVPDPSDLSSISPLLASCIVLNLTNHPSQTEYREMTTQTRGKKKQGNQPIFDATHFRDDRQEKEKIAGVWFWVDTQRIDVDTECTPRTN